MENNSFDRSMSIARKVIRAMSTLRLIALLTTVSALFVLIWHGYSLAWRVGLTGLLITLISHFIHNVVNNAMDQAVDSELEKRQRSTQSPIKKSKWQQKLDKLADEALND
jgi:ABC-type bacteriocin/lantibiotic exporter with double-glycine peptidase domain